MSTGECLRLLFAPYRRKLPAPDEPEPEPAEGSGEEKKDDDTKSTGEDQSTVSEQTSATNVEIDVQRSWFNLVCYGLPNLIVTQM